MGSIIGERSGGRLRNEYLSIRELYLCVIISKLLHSYLIHKLPFAQIPKAIVKNNPPKLKIKMGASPPSSVVPTLSPTFLAYLLLGPEH